MKQASIAQLKARLSEYLAAARRGEDVIVTDRGRPVARLTGLDAEARSSSRIAELLRAGLVRPPSAKLPSDFLEAPAPADPTSSVARTLIEERGEGW